MNRTALIGLACLGWAWGCGGEADAPAADDPAPPPVREPTPYVPDIDEAPPTPSLDEAALQQAVVDALPLLWYRDSLSAVPEIIEGLIDLEDPECPGGERYEEGGRTIIDVENACENAAGVRFTGGLSFTRFDFDEDEGAIRVTGFTIESAGLRIEAPDGRFFEASGYMDVRQEVVAEEGRAHGVYMGGQVRADVASAAGDPWLDGRLSGRLERYVFVNEVGGVYSGMTASTAVPEGPISALSVGGLQINSDLCADEPTGVFSVREADGLWHDVVFDGFFAPDYEAYEERGEEPPEAMTLACDGCGQHLFGGAPGEPVCGASDWLGAFIEEARR